MQGTIRVDTSELYHFGTMLGQCRDSLQLSDQRPDPGQVGNGELRNALDHFFNNWNYKRSDLADRLGKLSAGVSGAASAYLRAETDLQHAFSTDGPEGPRGGHWGMVGDLPSDRVKPFASKGPGRADVVEALYGTVDSTRVASGEIEIRKLDNGRYMVVLPGVEDLSNKTGAVLKSALTGHAVDPWYDGEQPDSVRRMAYALVEARDTSDTFINPYATRVMEQMQKAGIPPGADVMFVGHSFGAYTAMELAGDPRFNSAGGVPGGGYHVNVTHVVAAGAETTWKLPELPKQTSALILNNRNDRVIAAESLLHGVVKPQNPNQLNVEFWGGGEGYGHSPNNYATWLSAANDRPTLNAWLDGAGSMYSGGGTSYAVKVPDYH